VSPPRRVWVLASLELLAAALVTNLVLSHSDITHPAHHHHMSAPIPPGTQWGWWESSAGITLAVCMVWLVARRSRTAAWVGALAAVALLASGAARTVALNSHLVAMVVIETAMTLIPLLLFAATRGWHGSVPARLPLLVLAAMGYAGSIAAIHLPALHDRAMAYSVIPIWTLAAAVLMGLAFWFGVLRSPIPVRLRRMILIGAQEVVAFIGLLSLFGAWPTRDDMSAQLLPPMWDQRLGGFLMLLSCATATAFGLNHLRKPLSTTLEREPTHARSAIT
jgi:hypothetical protein